MTTLKEIAKEANVSLGTVDRVIHKRGGVSSESEAMVKKALRKLNYTPNIFARQLKRTKPFYFGVLMPDPKQDAGFWERPASGIEKAVAELNAHKVDLLPFYYNRYSHMSFSRAADEVLSADLDGLLIAPVFTEISQEFVSNIPSSLPFVFFDTYIPQSSCLSCIMQDSFQSGQLSARLMHLLIPQPSTIGAIQVLPKDYHIEQRIKGFETYFSSYPSYQIKVYSIIRGDPKITFTSVTEKILQEQPEIKGIFVSNALVCKIARILEKNESNKNIHLIGYDLLKENLDCLRSGVIDFLISQQSEQQGYLGIYTLFRHIVMEESVKKKIMMPIDIITQENVDYYHSP